MATINNSLNKTRQLGIGLIFIALALGGCGGKGSSTPAATAPNTPNTQQPTNQNPAVIPTAAIKITPMKGQFSEGTTVKVKRAKDGVVVGSCKVDTTGSCSAIVQTSETGPFLIEAGIAGDQYFDESTGALATVPAGQPALRALIPNASPAIGVTALTELAVGQIEGHAGGIAGTKVTDVIAANATIGNQFGVPNPLATPTVIGATTANILTGTDADDYALKLAGIAKMTKNGGDAIQALHDLRDDIKDGVLDGKKGPTVITTLNIAAPTGTQTYQDAMSAALNTQVTAATAAYATAGTAVPTVTMTVADLAALLNAAMQVGAATQTASAGTVMTTEALNTQIANTVQAQVAPLAVAVATGNATTIAAATTTATTAGTASGTTLATLPTNAASGTYVFNATTGMLTLNWTSSNFLCNGPTLGTTTQPAGPITATSMPWGTQGVNNMVWQRATGVAGSILGTWASVPEPFSPNSWVITFDAAGTVSVTGVIAACGSTNGGNAGGPVTMSGHVYVAGSSVPIQGAIISLSIATQTAVTDANGYFSLVTTAPANYCCTPYTVSVSATGYQTGGGNATWGDHATNLGFPLTPVGGTTPTPVPPPVATGAVAANNFIAMGTTTGVYEANFQLNAAAGTMLQWGRVNKKIFTPAAVGGYTASDVNYQFNNGATWSLSTLQAPGTVWDLTPTSPGGWVDTSVTPMNLSVAADGSLTVTNLLADGSSMGSSFSMQLTELNLGGQPVEGCYAFSSMGVNTLCTNAPYGTATYPAFATGFRFSNQIQNNDQYSIDMSQGSGAATDMNGVALTALPMLGNSFCINSYGSAAIYEFVAGAAQGSPNYTQKWIGQGACTAGAIATAVAQTFSNPVTLSIQLTGNTSAPEVLSLLQGNCNGCGNEIIAYIPTKGVFQGWFDPQGASKNSGSNLMTNRTAFDAMVNTARQVACVNGLGAAVPTALGGLASITPAAACPGPVPPVPVGPVSQVVTAPLQYLPLSVTSPIQGSVFTAGTQATISWNNTALLGNTVTLYILQDNPVGLVFDNTILAQRYWRVFATGATNNGTFTLDPALLMSNGNGYKILIVTDTGNWGVSEGLFVVQ
ncbi:MAG: hypothetical protein HOO97_05845 [Sideroxydans sp.]|nr:hypothetical protein [Sideroxydans sp.]